MNPTNEMGRHLEKLFEKNSLTLQLLFSRSGQEK